jgi:hypothetical protein
MPLRNTHIYTPGLDRMVRANGEHVVWTPASTCPCRLNRANPDPACLMCGGFGAFWDDADNRRRPILATVADLKLTRQVIDAAQLEKGTLILSTDYAAMPMITVNDRIEFTTRMGEPWEGENAVVTTDGRSVLSYTPVIVESVLTGNPLVGASSVVRYPCYHLATGADPATLPADAACYWQPGVRHLTWLTGKGPAAGSYVALRYRARLEWVAYQTPTPRFSRGTDLTPLVALLLKHRLLARMRDLSAGAEEQPPIDRKRKKQLAW